MTAKRYEIRVIQDPECTLIGRILATTEDLEEAERLAVEYSQLPYGVAVVDRLDGVIDWGHAGG